VIELRQWPIRGLRGLVPTIFYDLRHWRGATSPLPSRKVFIGHYILLKMMYKWSGPSSCKLRSRAPSYACTTITLLRSFSPNVPFYSHPFPASNTIFTASLHLSYYQLELIYTYSLHSLPPYIKMPANNATEPDLSTGNGTHTVALLETANMLLTQAISLFRQHNAESQALARKIQIDATS
jgi:hypothetical protein